MFGINKKRLISNLKKIQVSFCSYSCPCNTPGMRCDCKYMQEDSTVRFKSEHYCGCPEISQALTMLAKLNKKDFAALAKKAKVDIVEG